MRVIFSCYVSLSNEWSKQPIDLMTSLTTVTVDSSSPLAAAGVVSSSAADADLDAAVHFVGDEDMQLTVFDIVVGLWLPGLLSVFGIVGNVLSLWVLSRDRLQSAALTSLKALAVSDVVLLVGALCQQILPLSCVFFGHLSLSWFCLHKGYAQV